ncbi:MAG TPA: DNA internalization-related competence protein ComEC/Rec2 [Pseudomonadales bacterium]|nr:DNA internalization-related competence protein ComEC/Rec2 [Pseudomonadales bacterium]
MPAWMLMFCVGCMVTPWLPVLPDLTTAWLSMLLAGCLWRVQPMMMGGLLGVAIASLSGHDYLQHRLPQTLEGRVLQVEACVADLLAPFDGRYRRLDIDILSVTEGHQLLPWQGRAQVGDYQGWPLQAGHCYAMEVKLKKPHSLHNFDLPDWGSNAVVDGILAQGYIRAVHDRRPNLKRYALLRLRQDVQHWLLASPLSESSKGLLAALLLGDKTQLTVQQWRDSQRTGTVHLLVVSGLHIGLMSLSFYWLGYGVAFGLPYFYGVLSRRRMAWLFAWVGGLAFALLSGWGLPAQRAVIMLSVAVWFALRRQFSSPWFGLVVACGLVLLWQPLASLSLGFWLSFGLVASLMAGSRGVSGWRQIVSMQVRCLVVSLPLLWWRLASISVVAPVVNLLLVPSMTLLLPLLFVLSVGAAWYPVFWTPIEHLLAALQWIMHEAAKPGWVMHDTPSIPTLALPSLVIGTFLLAAPMWVPMRVLGVILLVAAWWSTSPEHGLPVQMTVFDVGQGSAVLLSSDGAKGLYDTGPRYGDYSAMQRVILPSLMREGVKDLSHVWVSHSDSDHSGGWSILQRALPIKHSALPDNGACVRGAQWRFGRVAIHALWPPVASLSNTPNNRSCSLLLEVAGRRILMPGDIEASVERQLVALGLPTVDILFVPHHGSKTSSSQGFLDALRPRHVIIESGYRNRYGHPVEEVMARYRQISAEIWRTAVDGAIRININQRGDIEVVSSRRERPAFWH